MKKFFKKKFDLEYLLLAIVLLISIWFTFAASRLITVQQNHFVELAYSFVHGKLNIAQIPFNDVALFKDKYFIYFGPVAAIILVPFVAIFGHSINQHLLAGIFLSLDFIVIYKISLKFKLSEKDSLWFAIFFIFGTIFAFLTIVNFSSYLIQIVSVSFLIFSLFEYFSKKRWKVIGFWLALAIASKLTFILAASFFMLELLGGKRAFSKKLANFIQFFVPILITLILLAFYNLARFGNVFESGYKYAISIGTQAMTDAVSYGYFSLKHVPGNLYFFLFKGLEPVRANSVNYVLNFPYVVANPWGVGILITSPIFFFIFLAKLKDKYVISSFLAIILMLIPVLTYYGIGYIQYGYRYALDVYPFLLILLFAVFKQGIPLLVKLIMVLGIFLNFYLMLTVFGVLIF